MKDYRLEVFKKAALCRHFENQAYNAIQNKHIKYPAYLSAGQEFISCSIATVLEEQKINPDIFIQHRGHSTYLAFGGDIDSLILELIGDETDVQMEWVDRHLFNVKKGIYMGMTD